MIDLPDGGRSIRSEGGVGRSGAWDWRGACNRSRADDFKIDAKIAAGDDFVEGMNGDRVGSLV